MITLTLAQLSNYTVRKLSFPLGIHSRVGDRYDPSVVALGIFFTPFPSTAHFISALNAEVDVLLYRQRSMPLRA